MGALADFREDRRRYSKTAWLTQPSLWAVATYRLARGALALPAPIRGPARAACGLLSLAARIATSIEIPASAIIGPGLLIGHTGPVAFHGRTRIGRNCTVAIGVMVASVHGPEAPTIGDDVQLGIYAVVMGDIHVGDGAKVGAMTLVNRDVPPRTVVAGIPARPLKSVEELELQRGIREP